MKIPRSTVQKDSISSLHEHLVWARKQLENNLIAAVQSKRAVTT